MIRRANGHEVFTGLERLGHVEGRRLAPFTRLAQLHAVQENDGVIVAADQERRLLGSARARKCLSEKTDIVIACRATVPDPFLGRDAGCEKENGKRDEQSVKGQGQGFHTV